MTTIKALSNKTWPNSEKIAVSVTVMFETWSEGAAPGYSVQTTHQKSGTVDPASRAWSSYGSKVGVWRLIRMLDGCRIPGTFFTNGRCTEDYPDAVKQIVKIRPRPRRARLYMRSCSFSTCRSEDQSRKTIRKRHRRAGILRRQESHRLGQPGGRVAQKEGAGFLAQGPA